MPARMQFDLRSGRPAAAPRRATGSPMRLLLIGDFGGRRGDPGGGGNAGDSEDGRAAGAGVGTVADLSQRKPLRVDIDTLDAALRRIAPRLDLAGDAAAPAEALAFAALDDFHPDALADRAAAFTGLPGLRARLLDPARFDAAADELRRLGLATGAGAAGTTADIVPAAAVGASGVAVPDAETDAGALQRLLGRAPAAVPALAPAPAGGIDALIRSIAAPHVLPDRTAQQAPYVAALDAALNARMRRLLHAPRFRALEAAWRGVQFLVSRLDLGEELQLHLLDATPAELRADLATVQGDASRSRLYRLLCGADADAPDAAPWSLLAGLFDIGPGESDLDLLAGLGAVAAQTGAPLVCGATPALFGCDGTPALSEPDAWRPLDDAAARRWADLRRSLVAPWIGLIAPRLLLRLPYGQATDPTERFRFEEQAGAEPDHDTLLWGPGALAVTLLVGEAFSESGRDSAPGRAQDIADLPALTFRRDGDAQLQPCAEAWIGERAGQALLAAGVMPLLSHRQRAAVRLLRMQSIAEPAAGLIDGWG